MNMNLNSIPILGWGISLIANISLALPFWICWTWFEIGSYYFDFLPAKWQSVPFWECVGLFIAVSILKSVCLPSLMVDQTVESAKK